MDRIPNRHSDHRVAFCTFGAVAYELKVATLFADWRSTKLSSLIFLNYSVFLAKNLSQALVQLGRQLPCNVKSLWELQSRAMLSRGAPLRLKHA